MPGEVIVAMVMGSGFLAGAGVWWRCERYLSPAKGPIMISCVALTVVGGQLTRSWLEDVGDDQAVIALLILSGL